MGCTDDRTALKGMHKPGHKRASLSQDWMEELRLDCSKLWAETQVLSLKSKPLPFSTPKKVLELLRVADLAWEGYNETGCGQCVEPLTQG